MARRRIGDEVKVTVRPSEFRLPSDPSKPIVMIAGGIGIAPFRAFLMDRIHQSVVEGKRLGPGLMLYGCRDDADQVYMSLMEEACRVKALTQYDVGYAVSSPAARAATGSPRATTPRMAGQLVAEHSEQVWATLQDGGAVYLCGGARGFGQAVAAAIQNICVVKGGMTAEGATAHLAKLLETGQYVEDLAD